VNVRIRLDNLQAVADAAIAGLGLASLPNWLFPLYLRSGELVLVMDCECVQPMEIHVIWPQTRFLPAKTGS
jgi:DNA-binding transcriptional LysR family regulator